MNLEVVAAVTGEVGERVHDRGHQHATGPQDAAELAEDGGPIRDVLECQAQSTTSNVPSAANPSRPSARPDGT